MGGSMKKGFGIIEVLVAAVVLGFMIIGLNTLQKGNRESVLRVRARDAAITIAQDVIDSISAIGSASVKAGERKGKCLEEDKLEDLCRTSIFKSKTEEVKMNYEIAVDIESATAGQKAVEETDYLATFPSSSSNKPQVEHQFAKQVNVTVSWKFKNTDQSINISTVIR
jgi:Tfp pilus assembly protein PilV